MTKPHIHAALIKAWADGAEIEFEDNGVWYPCHRGPAWTPSTRYRVKPEPKPDMRLYGEIHLNRDWHNWAHIEPVNCTGQKLTGDLCMFVFDGETGELKDVQLLAKE